MLETPTLRISALAAAFAVASFGCGSAAEEVDGWAAGTDDVKGGRPPPKKNVRDAGTDVDAGTAEDHSALTWTGPGMCVTCHATEAREIHDSVHYQFQGAAPHNLNGTNQQQGKNKGAINAYCVYAGGATPSSNWATCNGCHAGQGAQPKPAGDYQDVNNIDCLVCHQDAYKRVKVNGVFQPDTAAMAISMDQAVRTVHRPTRASCLSCHAKAGGGDGLKRGDLALAHANTNDASYDVHMATGRGDLQCTSCHTTNAHRIAGKGSDLRVSDSNVQMACTDCHASKATSSGHTTTAVNRHVQRVACQTCHIPLYGKNASDTAATEATETHRDWTVSALKADGYHPVPTVANNLRPVYAFWDGKSERTLNFGDVSTLDPKTNKYPISRPVGSISGPVPNKLYPFKYKTASQPFVASLSMLTPFDVASYRADGNATTAAQKGLVLAGLDPTLKVTFANVDTMQLITHGVSPQGSALGCSACHTSTATQMSLLTMGYALKAPKSTLCAQCHSLKSDSSYTSVHDRHVRSRGYDCSLCHSFSRPELGLKTTP